MHSKINLAKAMMNLDLTKDTYSRLLKWL